MKIYRIYQFADSTGVGSGVVFGGCIGCKVSFEEEKVSTKW